MAPWRTLIQPLTALVLCLIWAAGPALGQDQAPSAQLQPLGEIQAETARSLQIASDLVQAAAHRLQETDRLEAQLTWEEQTLRTADVRLDMLRAARLDLEAVRSRIATLEGQIAHRTAALSRLQLRISALSLTLEGASTQDLIDPSQQATLRLLGEQADAQRAILNGFGQVLALDRRFKTLAEQRLRLFQGRIRIDTIDRDADAEQDPRVHVLESAITDLLREMAGLAIQEDSIAGNDPGSMAQRDLLETRRRDLITRAFLRQTELDLLGLRGQLDGLVALRGDKSTPLRLLTAADEELQAMDEELRGIQKEMVGERQLIAARRARLQAQGLTGDPAWAMAVDTESLIDAQAREILALRERIAPERTRFTEQIESVYADSLSERVPLPGVTGEWRRIAAGLAALPALALREQAAMHLDLRERAAGLTADGWAILVGGAIALITGILGLNRRLRRALRSHRVEPALPLAVPVQALLPVLPWTIPALLWGWVSAFLELPPDQWLPRMLLLGVWPASAFLLGLAKAELFAPDLSPDQLQINKGFYPRLRWGLVLGAVVCSVYVLTRTLPVSPLVADLLDRLAMVGLLVLAVPALGLKRLIERLAQDRTQPGDQALDQTEDRAHGHPTPASPGRSGTRLLAWLAQVAALALAAAGFLGLLGYVNLAWAIAADLGWLALVATLLYYVLGALMALRDAAQRRIDMLGGRDELWRREFLAPAHGLAVLLTWLLAGWCLLRLWGWRPETPPLRTLLEWGEQTLFHSGNLTLTPRDLTVATLLVAAAFWIGGWVRQVSFELAYIRVRDHGLRNALATFTQYLVVCCGVLLALRVLGLSLTTLMVFAASLGVGIGFGLQNLVNNFVSGIQLLVERPIRMGDIVTVGSYEGEVTGIGFRSLTLRTFDKEEVFIPNGTLITGAFVNWTRSDDIVRTVLTLGIGYDDDPDQAIALVREILSGYEPVLSKPPPVVNLWEFGDSAIVLRVEYCVHYRGKIGRNAVRSEVNRRIWYGFKAAGISIPYPQRDLHLHLDQESGALAPLRPEPSGPASPAP